MIKPDLARWAVIAALTAAACFSVTATRAGVKILKQGGNAVGPKKCSLSTM